MFYYDLVSRLKRAAMKDYVQSLCQRLFLNFEFLIQNSEENVPYVLCMNKELIFYVLMPLIPFSFAMRKRSTTSSESGNSFSTKKIFISVGIATFALAIWHFSFQSMFKLSILGHLNNS